MKAPLFGLACATVTCTALAASSYELTVLPSLAGTTACDIAGLNDDGLIVGHCSFVSSNGPTNRSMATLWQGGQAISLGTLGGEWSKATAVNQKGEIVGYADVGQAGVSHAFSYRQGMGHLHDLAPDLSAAAFAVNDDGIIAGSLWEDGSQRIMVAYRHVVTRVDTIGSVIGLSDRGTLLLGDWPQWRTMSLKNRQYSPWLDGHAQGINSSDNVVGTIRLPGDYGGYRAFLYSSGTTRILQLPKGMLPDQTHCWGYGLNDRNDVVGVCAGRPIMWRNDKPIDLLDRVVNDAPSEWAWMIALRINAKGQIAGVGERHGMPHQVCFLMTPIDNGDSPKP